MDGLKKQFSVAAAAGVVVVVVVAVSAVAAAAVVVVVAVGVVVVAQGHFRSRFTGGCAQRLAPRCLPPSRNSPP